MESSECESNLEGEDEESDSFEDAYAKPHFTCLYDYVSSKVCQDQQRLNHNGMSVSRQGATIEEIANYYVENASLVELKREKYASYNARHGLGEARDYINKATHRDTYTRLIEPQLARMIESYAQRKRATHSPVTIRMENLQNEKDIYAHLSTRIRYQDRAIRAIAHQLYIIKHSNSRPSDVIQNNNTQRQKAQVYTITASGTSGSGKSSVIEHIRPLFHMEPGGQNERCFKQMRFGNFSDKSHRNAITGAGQGFQGCDAPCLVDHLLDALSFIRARRTCNLIVLFIDELCKSDSEVGVLDSLNSLLGDGYLKRASDETAFQLPPDVSLLVYGTSNFGARAMMRLATQNTSDAYSRAKGLILEEMRAKGMEECNIGRLGEIVPFFPLTHEQARAVMRDEMDQKIEELARVDGQLYLLGEEDRDHFLTHYFDGIYVPEQGLRHPSRTLEIELRALHINLVQFLDQYMPPNQEKPYRQLPTLSFHTLPYGGDVQSVGDALDRCHELQWVMEEDGTSAANLRDSISSGATVAYFRLTHPSLSVPACLYVIHTPQVITMPNDEAMHIEDNAETMAERKEILATIAEVKRANEELCKEVDERRLKEQKILAYLDQEDALHLIRALLLEEKEKKRKRDSQEEESEEKPGKKEKRDPDSGVASLDSLVQEDLFPDGVVPLGYRALFVEYYSIYENGRRDAIDKLRSSQQGNGKSLRRKVFFSIKKHLDSF